MVPGLGGGRFEPDSGWFPAATVKHLMLSGSVDAG